MEGRARETTGGEPDDAIVIERVLAGETEQFAVLVGRHQAALYRHAASMVLDHDAASDMVQDAFVRAYTNLAACRDRGRFGAWLFQTLRNRCLDYLKEAGRRRVPVEAGETLVDAGEGPAVRAERREVRRRIWKALCGLPAAQREAFLLRYVEELPYAVMAELLDESESALKMRVLRAREALAAALAEPDVTPAQAGSSTYQK